MCQLSEIDGAYRRSLLQSGWGAYVLQTHYDVGCRCALLQSVRILFPDAHMGCAVAILFPELVACQFFVL